MSTATKSFNSSMTGAPVLSGSAGALIAVLDAVLVNGFALQSVSTLVVTDGVAVATVASTPAAAVGSVILVSGATPDALNGEQRVTAVTSNSVTFATTQANVTATGTITLKMAPAGWIKLFSGTNLAAYKSPSAQATGCVLRVDDSGTTTARVRGYESMSDVNTGLGLFPSATQWASGLWWTKSNAASAAARPWIIVADDRGVYVFVKNADASSEYQGNYFGDILPLKSNDPYACVLRANTADRSASVTALVDSLEYMDQSQTYDGLYAPRAANTIGGSVKHFQSSVLTIGCPLLHVTGAYGVTYPSPVDNGLMLSPVMIYSAAGYRGYYPGLRASPQITNSAFATGDKIAGSGDMAGKTVEAIKLGTPAPGTGQGVMFIDTLSNWR